MCQFNDPDFRSDHQPPKCPKSKNKLTDFQAQLSMMLRGNLMKNDHANVY